MELLEKLVYNIDLLEHYINIIQILLTKETITGGSGCLTQNVIKFIVILVKLYKY